MAAQNKKTSSQRKGGTTKKSNSSGRNSSGRQPSGKGKKKQSQGPDLLTIVVVLVAIVLVIVLISKHANENKSGEANNPTGSVSVTGTGVPENPTKDPESQNQDSEGAQTLTEVPKPTATPTEDPTPTPVPQLSESEAKRIAEHIVQLERYGIELLDDHLMIDGAEYYAFCVNDENGEAMSPLLIVEKKEGTLLCYDMSGVVASIEKFPLDKTETGNDGGKTLTEEEAKKKLMGYSGEVLGLAKEPSAYEMTVDDWTTSVEGRDCYGINLFETVNGRQRIRGTFYVALDGSAVFSADDVTGEFIER